MKRILYLHGLESKQGGDKVSYLSSKHYVLAPALNYYSQGMEQDLLRLFESQKPDVIIGSSIGGYTANLLSTKFNIPAILLNPALINPPLRFKTLESDCAVSRALHLVVLGEHDEVIPYKQTQNYLLEHGFSNIEVRPYGHRTPLEDFIDICEGAFGNL